MTKQKIIYVDMDNCMCDYTSSYMRYKEQFPEVQYPQSIPGLFLGLEPMEGALETIKWLHAQECFDVYILSSPSVMNPNSYSEKRQWVEKHLGMEFVRRLILSPHKNLNKGDYLIDDRSSGQGQELFEGKLLHFGSNAYPNWEAVKGFFEQPIENSGEHKFDELSEKILCFRAFDLRNRFEEPFGTFGEALEALQSDVAYLPEMAGSIVCYFKDSTSIVIPEHFYIEAKPHFSSRQAAVEWIQERKQKYESGSLGGAFGIVIANPKDPFEKQLQDALAHKDFRVVEPSKNDEICEAVMSWLSNTK